MKKYLYELENEELKKVYNNNEELKKELWEMKYEDLMFQQEQVYKDILGEKPWENGIEYFDHYNSFFLKLKSGIKLYEQLKNNKYVSGYFSLEEEKEYKELMKEAKKHYTNMNVRCNYNSDKYYENEEELEYIMENVLELIEKVLHQYENIDYTEEDFIEDVKANEYFEDVYIKTEEDNFEAYKDIAYTKSYC